MNTIYQSMNESRLYGAVLEAITVQRIGSVKAGAPSPALPPTPPAAATDRGVGTPKIPSGSPVIFFGGVA